MASTNEGNTSSKVTRGTGVSVTFQGATAMELRRLAENLGITPQLFTRRLVAEALEREYGVIVK